MTAMQVADIISDVVIFLELAEQESLDRQAAVQMMKQLEGDLRALDKAFLGELIEAFAVIAAENSGKVQDVIREIPHTYHLE